MNFAIRCGFLNRSSATTSVSYGKLFAATMKPACRKYRMRKRFRNW
jgi:hypothetical protein